jgi:Lar family restriction alleviation protein
MSDELKPCPFCGSDDVEIALTRVWWHLWYFCECQDCGAEGHSTIYKGSAIANWNMRSGQYELRARAEVAEARVAQLERELNCVRNYFRVRDDLVWVVIKNYSGEMEPPEVDNG